MRIRIISNWRRPSRLPRPLRPRLLRHNRRLLRPAPQRSPPTRNRPKSRSAASPPSPARRASPATTRQIPLAIKDDIYLNDVVQTAASSALGITFSDGTTFNLKANAQITIDNFVYEDGGKNNAGVFDVAKGTVAFVAAQVAKTGDMQITTPTATLGIRGTSGLVEVPAGATAASANNVNIKLYPDADGRVGRIEVNDRAGARLGFLTQGASGFAIRPGAGGVRFAAVPLTFSPQMIQRDQGFVRQVHSTQTLGRRVFDEQRAFRRANPGFVNPNRPIRQPGGPGGPGQLRPNGQPGQGGQNRPGQPPQPGLQNRPGQQQPGAPGRQGRQPPVPGSPQQSGKPPQPGQPGQLNRQQGQTAARSATARYCRPRPGRPGRDTRTGRRAATAAPAPGGPAGPAPVNRPPRLQQPGGPPAPGGAQPLPQQGGQLQRPRRCPDCSGRDSRAGPACNCRGDPRRQQGKRAKSRRLSCAEAGRDGTRNVSSRG